MKYRLHYCLTAAVLAGTLLLCAACGAGEAAPEKLEPPETEQTLPEQTAPEETSPPADQPFSFVDVADLEFYFSSGAGAWRTVLYIHADGSFDGEYLDSDMGDGDEAAYPNGTRYYNAFTGRFTEPERVNGHTYRMRVAELTHTHPLGEEVRDGVRWVYSEASGICGAEDVYLYLPGTPLAELPQEYRSWVGYYDLTQTEETELPFYGLYNEAEQNGFSSSVMPAPAELFRSELAWVELTAAELEKRLQNAGTQTEMNMIAADLYRLWDDLLNTQWGCLKRALDGEAMGRLTAEQLAWIGEKEAAAAAAGAAYAGGSLESMAYGLKAAELTKERVYTLAEYLP